MEIPKTYKNKNQETTLETAFTSWLDTHGLIKFFKSGRFLIEVHCSSQKDSKYIFKQKKEPKSGHYLYVYQGEFSIATESRKPINLTDGMYSSVGDNFTFTQHSKGKALIIKIYEDSPFFMVGGAIEKEGRLKYIDGCTDSLIIPPVKKGMSCLNHLHFPKNISQTFHTHPSVRVGIVARGSGICHTRSWEYYLSEGLIFIIDAEKEHRFTTDKRDSMDVIAFHPDSDFGAEDNFHPMINKTIIRGVSARHHK
tara:strand:- start:477 stop:1235 length:759 start_codon:yes stop_codon:yes gene_type:complete